MTSNPFSAGKTHNSDSHVAEVANAGMSTGEVSIVLGRCISSSSAGFYWSLIQVGPSFYFIPSLLLFLLSLQLLNLEKFLIHF